jgi:succinyl-diaminopimelate desuccinylase
VPAGDLSKWKNPPFKATVKNNKMFGRGAADSKIAIAIFVFLSKELRNDTKFNGNLILGFDADEQSGEFTGIKNILKKKPKADVCVLGYQGIDEISIGARGWLRIKIAAKGKSAHTGARYNRGINAIHQMTEIISALRKINLNAKKEPLFDFGSSLNVSLIQGGAVINIVLDECEAKIDIRFLPSQTKNEILNKINKKLKELKKNNQKISYKTEILQSENAFLTNPKNEFIKLLQQTAQKKLKRKMPLTVEGKGSAGNLIIRKNIPIVNSFGCDCGNIHAPNEWVDIKTLPKVFGIYKETILEFCKK